MHLTLPKSSLGSSETGIAGALLYVTVCFLFAVRTLAVDANQLFDKLHVHDFSQAEGDDLARKLESFISVNAESINLTKLPKGFLRTSSSIPVINNAELDNKELCL